MGCCNTACMWTCIALCLGWHLLASGLLFVTWNKVVGEVFKVKSVKYWQALLFLVTVSALVAPRWYMMQKMHCGKKDGCSWSKGKKDCQHGLKEGDEENKK